MDSRTRLFGESPNRDSPSFRDFLKDLVSQNPALHVYVLIWSFPILLADSHETALILGQDPFQHPRIHFRFDSSHPPGATHHQKIAVVDDALAFAGGMDVAGGRWDTPAHIADDRRRGADDPYPPSHDVQAMVDGEAARALAAIVHDRWQKATGESMPWAAPRDASPWPAEAEPDLLDVAIGITRSGHGDRGVDGLHPIERLHLDLIAAARKSIYIENQYLTSKAIADALAARLRQARGPEVVIVLPRKNSGWLEEHTIEVLRFRVVAHLRENDRFGRLRVCYPKVPNLAGEAVCVHAKVMAIDDCYFRVGSSNLTNRSMRLDTECDLTIEAHGVAEERAIAAFRNRLLGEHLGMPVEMVAAHLNSGQTMGALIDSRSSLPRCLKRLEQENNPALIAAPALIDPCQPLSPSFVIKAIASWVWERPALLFCPLVAIAVVAGFAAAAVLPVRR